MPCVNALRQPLVERVRAAKPLAQVLGAAPEIFELRPWNRVLEATRLVRAIENGDLPVIVRSNRGDRWMRMGRSHLEDISCRSRQAKSNKERHEKIPILQFRADYEPMQRISFAVGFQDGAKTIGGLYESSRSIVETGPSSGSGPSHTNLGSDL
jgi:hypothetical protein